MGRKIHAELGTVLMSYSQLVNTHQLWLSEDTQESREGQTPEREQQHLHVVFRRAGDSLPSPTPASLYIPSAI